MSQVVVTNDSLRKKREKSLDQERKIQREAMFEKWQLSDVSKTDLLTKLVGVALLPVVALWGLIAGAFALMMGLAMGLFRFLGRAFQR